MQVRKGEPGMGNVSVDKKMELLQQIRSRNQRDNYDMFRREKTLYGRTSAKNREAAGFGRDLYGKGPDRELYDNPYGEDEEPAFSTFSLRVFLAAAAFALLILSDKTGSKLLGLSAETCFNAIGADYEESIAAWAEENLIGSQAQP